MKDTYLEKLRQMKEEADTVGYPADAFCFFDPETEDTTDDGFLCARCDFSCDREGDMVKHMKEQHGEFMKPRKDVVLDTFTNGKIVKKFDLDNANPHLCFELDEFGKLLVGFIGINTNYYSHKELEVDKGEEKAKDFFYKANVNGQYLKERLNEVIKRGVPNKDVYAWLQENGKYCIRYRAEDKLDF